MSEVMQHDLFTGEAVAIEPNRNGNMMKDFLIPPFSILDTSQAYWLERKRAWLSLGIQSEMGRGANLIGYSDTANKAAGFATEDEAENPLMFDRVQDRLNEIMGGDGFKTGTSVFDPVLCEIIYRWFCPPKAVILDPFAGGSVRGIVAAKLGHIYKGMDLSAPQIEANMAQADLIVPDNRPLWFWGDSRNMRDEEKMLGAYDFIFSCPPYFDLEVYSNEPGELSAMGWDEFLQAYREIIDGCVFMLKPNRFACFVVGEIRDENGIYRNFVGETIAAFEAAGAKFYNEAILVTSVGSLPIRAGKQFRATRKLGKRHQNVLIFVKGDPAAAADYCGEIDTTSSFWAEPSAAEQLNKPEPQPAAALSPEQQADEYLEAEAAAHKLEDFIDEQPAKFIEPVTVETAKNIAAPEPALITAAAKPVNLTPVQYIEPYWLKRDDLFEFGGVRGGKVRTCLALATAKPYSAGLVTAGARSSPQVSIVAHVAAALGIPSQGHVPTGELSPLLKQAQDIGMEIKQHQPGYNSVIRKRARDAADELGWTLIPFGMEDAEAVNQTADQTQNIPPEVERIVIPVGSGMSLAGILTGLQGRIINKTLEIIGVRVGANPEARLDMFAPENWRDLVTIVESPLEYDTPLYLDPLGDCHLDPIYEAKCIQFMQPGDLLWVIGVRNLIDEQPAQPAPAPAQPSPPAEPEQPPEPEDEWFGPVEPPEWERDNDQQIIMF